MKQVSNSEAFSQCIEWFCDQSYTALNMYVYYSSTSVQYMLGDFYRTPTTYIERL